jgi:ATP-dependent protease ClpP protease subunit
MNKLLKIIKNHSTPRPWFNFDTSNGVVYINDFIGSDFWGEGLSAKTFVSNLKELEKKYNEIDIHINCKGGDIAEALQIYNFISSSKCKYNGYVDSIAFSCASFIFQACDMRYMPPASEQMMHNAWAVIAGNAKELRLGAEQLDVSDKIISGIYVNSTGKSEKEILKMMEAETYMDGATSVEMGFADELLEDFKMVACSFDLEDEIFPNLPKSFKNYQNVLKKRIQENALRDAGLSRSGAKKTLSDNQRDADKVNSFNINEMANELIKKELSKCLKK